MRRNSVAVTIDAPAAHAADEYGDRMVLTFMQERTYTRSLGARMGALVTRAAQRKFEADLDALCRLIAAEERRNHGPTGRYASGG